MPKYLSQEWLDLQRQLAADQPERPGATARIQHVITGGPAGEVKYYWILDDGHLVESALGEVPGADVTMTEPYEDKVRIMRGDLDASAAFMQGRIKVAGDMEKVMLLMPITNDPDYKRLQHDLLEQTDF